MRLALGSEWDHLDPWGLWGCGADMSAARKAKGNAVI